MIQIAGLVARRIVSFVHEGQTIEAGERFGLIRFGSRLDVFLPPGTPALVSEGQTAVAGETVLADFQLGDGGRTYRTNYRSSGLPGCRADGGAGTGLAIWRDVQTPYDPKSPEMRRRRFRPIPVRMLVPNFITLLAICAGLTAIRLSTEGRMELAVAAIVFAAVLDGLDGRVARMIKGQSKFGAELDSLADFVNFGVAPGLILYFWQLHDLSNVGWIAAMVFRDQRRPAARPLQCDDGRSEQARLRGEFLHRRACAGGCDRGASCRSICRCSASPQPPAVITASLHAC